MRLRISASDGRPSGPFHESGFGELLFGDDLPAPGLAMSLDPRPDSGPCSVRRRMSESEGRPDGQAEELGLVAGRLSDRGCESGLESRREAVRGGAPCSSLRRTSDVEARSIDSPERIERPGPRRVAPVLRCGLTLGRMNVGGFDGLVASGLRLGAVGLDRLIPDRLWPDDLVLPPVEEGGRRLGPLGEVRLRLGAL